MKSFDHLYLLPLDCQVSELGVELDGVQALLSYAHFQLANGIGCTCSYTYSPSEVMKSLSSFS